jgi:glycosyltransferase involved in cell wall biosynthesis
MACTNYWDSPFQVGSHHIARGFADKGFQVAFISNPISPLHILNGIGQELKERWLSYRKGGSLDYGDKIWSYVPLALTTPNNKPLLQSEWLQQNWYKLSLPLVIEKIKQHGFAAVDILYFDNPNHFYLLDHIQHKQSVFRIADKSIGFSNSTRAARDMEKKVAGRVDMVLYTAQNLKEHVEILSPKKSIYFPNGVNYQHFADGSHKMPIEYIHIKRPIALYVGAMVEWFDFDLMNHVAKKLPNISFVFIGPDLLAKQRLNQLDNIHILGRRDYADLPPYLHNADVGLIPFDVKGYADLVNNVNPLKLYEYMACGLPVVAVKWKELALLQSPAMLSVSPDEFVEAIEYSLEQGSSRKINQAYASQHDWASVLEWML